MGTTIVPLQDASQNISVWLLMLQDALTAWQSPGTSSQASTVHDSMMSAAGCSHRRNPPLNIVVDGRRLRDIMQVRGIATFCHKADLKRMSSKM